MDRGLEEVIEAYERLVEGEEVGRGRGEGGGGSGGFG
jgi:hypothetical protein